MATDQSPPRLRLIISIALGTVVTLVSLKFVFESYFTDIMDEAAASKLTTPDEVNAARVSQTTQLTSGPIPIDKAMEQLSTQGRLGSAVITPQPSDDQGALVGWAHLHDVDQPEGSDGGATAAPVPAMTAAGASDAGMQNNPPGPPPGADGGAATMPTAPNAGADAGAPKPHATTVAPGSNGDAGAPH